MARVYVTSVFVNYNIINDNVNNLEAARLYITGKPIFHLFCYKQVLDISLIDITMPFQGTLGHCGSHFTILNEIFLYYWKAC